MDAPTNHACPYCGKELHSDARFCHHCGESLQQGAERQNPETPASRLAGPRTSAEPDQAETTLWEGRFSPKGMIHGWIVAVLVTLVAIVLAALTILTGVSLLVAAAVVAVVWIGMLCLLAYRTLSTRYQLTDQRLIHHRGILRRVTNRIEVIDIDDVTYSQSLLERLVGVGRITILSSDRSDPECRLAGIDQVEQVATLIDNARRQERIRRGLYVESI